MVDITHARCKKTWHDYSSDLCERVCGVGALRETEREEEEMKLRITDIRAFDNYHVALSILGAYNVGDVLEYNEHMPIFDILIEKGWVQKV
jgi:hypothetical protein